VTTSRFGVTVDALVSLFATTSAEAVYDGWPLTGDVPADYIIVGGTEDPDDESGEFDQDWAALGKQARTETAQITCAILAGTGDDSIKVARDRALAILAECEALLRTTPALGVLEPGWAHLTSVAVRPVRNTEGTYVRVRFTVAYQSRLV
jgi:hypothetical protein